MPTGTITIAVKDLPEVALAVNMLREYTRDHVRASKDVLLNTDTSHTGALESAIHRRDKAAKKSAAAADVLISFGIELKPLVSDIDQTLPAKIDCDCEWCSGEWK